MKAFIIRVNGIKYLIFAVTESQAMILIKHHLGLETLSGIGGVNEVNYSSIYEVK